MTTKQESFVVGETYPLDVSSLEANPEQVRKYFDESKIEALANDIKRNGLIQNITFTTKEGRHIIVAGERRWRAVKRLGWTEILGKYVEGDLFELALMENLVREDLTAVERSESIAKLKEFRKFETHEELANHLGLKRNTVSEILKVNDLPQEIRDAARDKPGITRHDLLTIARVKGEKRQRDAFEKLLASQEEKNPKGVAESKSSSRRSKVVIAIEGMQELINRFKAFDVSILEKATEDEKKQFTDELEALIKELRKVTKKVKPTSEEGAASEGTSE